ncbi:MAG: response regulator transcription factor, partial [Nonomuraea sp.]|nr:response regulator transcription factor [Nonomuraea sp.]
SWDAAVSAWRSVGQPYALGRALVRSGGAEEVREAAEIAAALGSASLAAEAEAASRRLAPVLSARELEVLALVAEGLSNRQVAERLFISARTAGVHVSNILAKLGAGSRVEAAAVARRTGMI